MSAFADVVVSAFDDIHGQHLLTYPRRIQNDAICILPNTAILILNPNQNGRLRLPAASVVATQALRVFRAEFQNTLFKDHIYDTRTQTRGGRFG